MLFSIIEYTEGLSEWQVGLRQRTDFVEVVLMLTRYAMSSKYYAAVMFTLKNPQLLSWDNRKLPLRKDALEEIITGGVPQSSGHLLWKVMCNRFPVLPVSKEVTVYGFGYSCRREITAMKQQWKSGNNSAPQKRRWNHMLIFRIGSLASSWYSSKQETMTTRRICTNPGWRVFPFFLNVIAYLQTKTERRNLKNSPSE